MEQHFRMKRLHVDRARGLRRDMTDAEHSYVVSCATDDFAVGNFGGSTKLIATSSILSAPKLT
jgi:hypothetical protein